MRDTGVTVTALLPGPTDTEFKDHIVAASMKNKAQVAAGRIMPETAKAATQARQTAPGSGS